MSEHQFFLVNIFSIEAHARRTRMQWPSLGWHTQSQVSTELMEHRNDVPEANGPPNSGQYQRTSQPRRVVLASSTASSTRYSPAKPELHWEKLENEKDDR